MGWGISSPYFADLPNILDTIFGFSGVITLLDDIIASLFAFLNILNPFSPNLEGECKLDCGEDVVDDDMRNLFFDDGEGD